MAIIFPSARTAELINAAISNFTGTQNNGDGTYTSVPLTVEENLKIAKAQAERGADIVKIVNNHENAGDIPSCIESIQKIKASVDKELLFLVSGAGSIIRYIGANFGVCMYLCLQTHEGVANPVQPLLTKVKAVRDNINLNF